MNTEALRVWVGAAEYVTLGELVVVFAVSVGIAENVAMCEAVNRCD